MTEMLRQDLRDSLRALRRTPGFTATAIVILTLSIGANASIFALLNALTLRPLPVRNPEELVSISTVFRTGLEAPLSFPMFLEFGRRQTILSGLFGWFGNVVLTIEANGDLASGTVVGVTGNLYSELGVTPAVGRSLLPADVDIDSFTAAHVAVLGYGFWQRRYGGDSAAIGRVVRVQGLPFTVVGIAPRGFKGFGLLAEADVTIPLTAYPQLFRSGELNYANAGNVLWMKIGGRLRPGTTVSQAQGQLEALWPAIKAAVIPPTHAGAQRDNFLAMRLVVQSLSNGQEPFLRQTFTRPLHFILGIALVVLLITCVNLASLMLTRMAGREHELAVRTTLGASPWQAGRRVLIETMVLAFAGAGCGLGLAYWASAVISAAILPSAPVPIGFDASPDLRVLGFTALAAIVAGVGSALAPAWRATRRDLHDVLQQHHQTSSAQGRFGRVLIAGQIALSVILLTNASLLVRSLQELLNVDPGFAVEGVHLADFQLRPENEKRPDPEIYYRALIERVKTTPGVEGASVAHGSLALGALVQPVSRMSTEPADGIPAAFNSVSPGFFASLAIPIVQGRDFTWADRARSPRVVILSRSLANQLFPSGDAIGQRVRIGTQPYRQDLEIVGIVPDARLYDMKDRRSNSAYVPALQHGELTAGGFLIIRGQDIDENQVRRAVRLIGPDYVASFTPLKDEIKIATAHDRIAASLAAAFGGLTLLLAAIGVGGLASYTVTKRTKDIAIRVALGADRQRIVKSVVGNSISITSVGVAVGLSAALISARFVRALFFGVGIFDPAVLLGVPTVLLIVSACACIVPAVRAATLDPIAGLRAE